MITRFHAKYYASLLSQQAVGESLDSISQSLLSSSVDINPHQIDAALFAFNSPLSKGVVLADEVGLGKTIEAGLVICQYWAVGKRKIIIISPASLRKQWEAELLDKFGIPSEIFDTKNFNAYLRDGRNPFFAKRAIICSYNFAAKHKADILTNGFDLAVVDEAHNDAEEQKVFDDDEIDIPRLKAEIETIDGFIRKAKAIRTESKASALLTALEESFKKLHEQGALRKALIFTESTKTQAFLRDYLEANGYAGKIVLFNGKASEPQTNEIYKRWCLAHPDSVSGIKAADRRAAAVDYFQNEADIMIATEAAAEGLNLQFCSLVINYDLPWNPQRIEQRIGRCHRYGQKHDVVVVNFINIRNFADVRVFDLLSTKFKLFDDVFGASDEVLGQADNIDIESRIWEIYQQCRSEEEISAAFEKLQADMQEQIDERMDEVRAEVLEKFDINVQEHLRMTKDNTGAFLNRYHHIFWELTKFVLSTSAVFNDAKHSFYLRTPVAGCKPGKYILISQDGEGTPYRLSHPLAQHVINTALSLNLDDNSCVTFDESAMQMNAAVPEYLQSQSGWMILSQLAVSSFADEQHTLFSAFTDDGRMLSQEECEKLFLNGGTEHPNNELKEEIRIRLEKDAAQHAQSKLLEIDSRNLHFFKQEENRIYQWEHDMIDGIEAELSTVKRGILQAERDARNAASVQEKLECERKVEELKRKKRRLRNELEDREEEASSQRRMMIADLERRMIQSTEKNILFLIRWNTK